ncbi:TPA: hypothetical protein NIB20_001438 [Pseudomonas aeruginosa]|nr:hypothetical protein [Pseudomonas aeruginosa]
MMAADSLHVVVHRIVPSGALFRWSPPCRCACHADADPAYRALHMVLQLEWLSPVQASCLERARPMAVAAFTGGQAASSVAPSGRRHLERKRQAKAEGKTKGRGTGPRRKPVCTWGERGTERLRRRAAFGARVAPMQAYLRASHDRTRQSLQGEKP